MTLPPGSAALLLNPPHRQAARDGQPHDAPEVPTDAAATAMASALDQIAQGPLAVLDSIWETARGLGVVSCRWVADPGGHVLGAHGTPAWPSQEPANQSPDGTLRLPVTVAGHTIGALHLRVLCPGGLGGAEVTLLAGLAAVLGHACVHQSGTAASSDASIVDGPIGPVVALDHRGAVLRLNAAAEALLGLSAREAVGRPWEAVLGSVAAGADLSHLLAADDDLAQTRGVRIPAADRQGSCRVYLWRVWHGGCRPAGDRLTILYAVDVTDQSRLEHELRAADRLIMAGQLATGLAHELRNPLSAVQGFGEHLQQQIGEGAGIEHLRLLIAQARRAEGIVSQLLGFAAPANARRQPVDINDLIRGAVSLLSYQLRRARVDIALALQDDLPSVLGNATELQQVLVNLLVNAQHALSEARDARVTITTGVVAGQVEIAVVDNGPGIASSVLERVFEPFVSTKPEGMGTGLGLSICAGIVEQHHGSIVAHNRAEGGAEFILRLPLGTEPAAACCSADAELPETPLALVVDDDEAIRALLGAVLTDAGLQVHEAPDGSAALEQLGACRPHVVICDLNMPGMTGRDLYETLLDQCPETARRMVFTTGSVAGDALRDFARECGNPVLVKPFPLRELLSAVRTVLQG